VTLGDPAQHPAGQVRQHGIGQAIQITEPLFATGVRELGRRRHGWQAELVPLAYDDTPRELWPYAERSLLAHLLKLEHEGRASREGDGWRRSGPLAA
jgi:hypothetical protein